MDTHAIYADYAATTPLLPGVLDVMIPYLQDNFGNPSSIHAYGRQAGAAIAQARATVARIFDVSPRNIIFTGSGTESDNQALITMAMHGKREEKCHLVVSSIEHHAVLECAHYLETIGFEITYVDPNSDGVVEVERLEAALRPDTCGISVMTVNNETGVVQPIQEIAHLANSCGIYVHTDAIQAVGHVNLPVVGKKRDGVAFLSLSGHKFGGPKGVGTLIVDDGIELERIIHGGGQERGYRAGTTNVAGIVGLAFALEQTASAFDGEYAHITALHEYLEAALVNAFPDVLIVGKHAERSPVITNVCVPGVKNEALVQALDMEGVYVSAGSACMSGAVQASHVLQAMGVPDNLARGAVRISLGSGNTQGDIDAIVHVLQEKISLQKSIK